MGGGGQIKIKTVKIKEHKSFFPLIYIFSAFLFIFTLVGRPGGVMGKVQIRDRCLIKKKECIRSIKNKKTIQIYEDVSTEERLT